MIEIQGISKSFENKDVLTNIDLNLERGKVNMIIGKSGAGKSTIINLLPRFYDPKKGIVSIDGQNISAVTLSSLRKNISLALQQIHL